MAWKLQQNLHITCATTACTHHTVLPVESPFHNTAHAELHVTTTLVLPEYMSQVNLLSMGSAAAYTIITVERSCQSNRFGHCSECAFNVFGSGNGRSHASAWDHVRLVELFGKGKRQEQALKAGKGKPGSGRYQFKTSCICQTCHRKHCANNAKFGCDLIKS